MPVIFENLLARGFDLECTYHADAILYQNFPEAVRELEEIVLGVDVPIEELIRGGGGEAQVTQRLRRKLHERGWRKVNFTLEKKINERTTFAQTHEVDHVKSFESGTVALEIEWNNKDPFFDRDLDNFNRLHADGGISIGVIVTRGSSLQDGLSEAIRSFATARGIAGFEDLREFALNPTVRQRGLIESQIGRGAQSFGDAWAKAFMSDKFGMATTHWNKLASRLERGVGSPCPVVGIGIPLSCVSGL